MRTMHSIGYALTKFDCEVTLVSPPDMSPTKEWKAELSEQNLRFREVEHVEAAVSDADVIYMEPVVQPDYTKARDERGESVGKTPANYRVTRELLRKKGKSDVIILHSLPRMDELPPDVDGTRHARYWEEAFNGVVLRMALLALVLGAVE
jgi:aspartate carbamoyltransferase catalytic subunit